MSEFAGELAAEFHLSADELALVPFATVFTLVGYGGWPAIADDTGPLMIDGLGIDLPDGRALVRCQIPNCTCGGPRVWPSPEEAATMHGSWIARPDGPRAARPAYPRRMAPRGG